ncbi:esterase/lipase family protein [Thiohalorhabdus methylotrophus]|uniref:Esterase/lipase family protein n=1 Tax=Thiohalorhabdus methylotrophus TaxID=3242694 RepID=A0ABV4TS49_9GAMM
MTGPAAERPVVLVHGLWMPAAVMLPLAIRLRRAGFTPYRFGYPSRRHSVADHARRLDHWLGARFEPGQPLGLVGHSLGGLVLRALAQRNPAWFETARTVMLGTPNQGASGAAFIARWREGRWWLGVAGRELCGTGELPWPALPGETGVIAGTRWRWWTRWFLDRPNDGLVRVAETALPRTELRTFPVGHTGLLLNRRVAKAAAHFLREGRFGEHGEPAGGLC